MPSPGRLPAHRFARIVRDAPLVSIDLVALAPDGSVLLGLRTNEPARGSWFVPGGIVRKGERLREAFERITADELGMALPIARAEPLGVHEHLYDTNFRQEPGYGTHYVVLPHRIRLETRPARLPRAQHAAYRWCPVAELLADAEVHPYVKRYFGGG